MAEAAAAEQAYGGQTMVEPLRRVLVRRPPADTSDWRRFGWRSQPDPVRMAEEHEAFCLLLEEAGAEIVVAPPTTLDAIYAYDPAIVGDAGAVLLRPGKPERLEEVDAVATDLERAGVPVASRLEEPASAEGGDTAWLDESTLLAGRGYRTNTGGIEALERILGVETLAFDLPHFHGPGEVMHLLSLFSPLDRDLVVGYPRLMPVALVQLFGRSMGSASSRCRTTSSRPWARTCSPSRPVARARPRAQRRDEAAPRTGRRRRRRLRRRGAVQGRRSARPASRGRCCAADQGRAARRAGTTGAGAAARGSSGGAWSCSTELKPCPRSFGSNGSFVPSGSTPSIASPVAVEVVARRVEDHEVDARPPAGRSSRRRRAGRSRRTGCRAC